MSNYKLTTDLIADCMALIPQNVERLNFGYLKYENPKSRHIVNRELWQIEDNNGGFMGDFHDMLPHNQFLILSHCLRTIPEFQEPNEKYEAHKIFAKEAEKKIEEELMDMKRLNKPTVDYAAVVEPMLEKVFHERSFFYTPKTIAAATLRGQGEFPPSTLEELCESYKKVM